MVNNLILNDKRTSYIETVKKTQRFYTGLPPTLRLRPVLFQNSKGSTQNFDYNQVFSMSLLATTGTL